MTRFYIKTVTPAFPGSPSYLYIDWLRGTVDGISQKPQIWEEGFYETAERAVRAFLREPKQMGRHVEIVELEITEKHSYVVE